MKDPDFIETVFRLTLDGNPIDCFENFHDTFEQAQGYAKKAQEYNKKNKLTPDGKYQIAEITTVTTIHEI